MTDQIEDQDVELDEEIEEAHDPKNAEKQSVDATAKAGDATKKAPARKGDKANAQSTDLKNAATKAESVEFNGDFSEDLNALVESEATLSEEIDRLETEYQEQLDEQVSGIKTDLVEKVDSYLNYVVENWMEENKLAIQSGLRSEIAEGFMDKLKGLFVESYVEVPESKVDLVDELATANEELEVQYNEAVAKTLEISEELEVFKRQAIIREASKDLAETQVEKLASLVESIDFEDEETFASKVATIKESYFTKKAATISEEVVDDDDDNTVEVSPMMEQYLNAIRKTNK